MRNNYFVKELEGNGHDQEATIPANKPSVLLFIDRSSYSSETRGKSLEALKALGVKATTLNTAIKRSNNTGKGDSNL